MSRYFFNIRGGSDIFDNEGTELKGAREVRIHMVNAAAEFFDDYQAEPNQQFDSDWEMEAVNEQGKIVASMTFSCTKTRS